MYHDSVTTLSIPMKENILDTIDSHTQAMLRAHNKVFVFRIDVQAENNAEFSQFNQRLMQSEKRAGIDAGYVAVAERDGKGKIHFHEVVLLDGNKTRSIIPHVKKANRIMNNLRGLPSDYNNGLIDDCNSPSNPQPNGIMIRRGDRDLTNLRNAYRQASYLAKEAQKDGFDKGTRTIFASQLKSGKSQRQQHLLGKAGDRLGKDL